MSQVNDFKGRLQEAMAFAGHANQRKWLADQIGVTQSALTLLINGQTKNLSAENAARAARALGVDFYWLATGEGEMKADTSSTWRQVALGLATAMDSAERGQQYALFCREVDQILERAKTSASH
jgi:transcriptional regulator with XRE-family HTH domain